MGKPAAPEMAATQQLKAATREAHEAIKDLRALVKELRDVTTYAEGVRDDLATVATTAFEERIDKAVEEGLEVSIGKLMEATEKAIEGAQEAVYKRFDTVASILLGEEPGSIPLTDYAKIVRGEVPQTTIDFIQENPTIRALLEEAGVDLSQATVIEVRE